MRPRCARLLLPARRARTLPPPRQEGVTAVDGEDADVVWPMHDVAGDNPNHRRRAVVRAPNRRRHVKLSHEEAFFLVADARVLRVRSDAPWPNEIPGQTPNPNKAYFDTEALWRVLCSTSDAEAFACHYVAYRHYRSKGYIPRSGLTFGADWILYGAHPSAAHSEFSVLVIPVVTDGKTGERTTRAPWHWRDVQSLVRLSTAVSKKVVALYVHHDAGVLLESVAADAPAANDADGSAAEPDAKRRRVEAPPPKGVLDFLATVSTTEVRLQRWTTALMERESRAQAARNAAAAAIAAVDAK